MRNEKREEGNGKNETRRVKREEGRGRRDLEFFKPVSLGVKLVISKLY
jgi:hypothetical protein